MIASLNFLYPGFRKTLSICAGVFALAAGLTAPANTLETHEICAQAIDQIKSDPNLPKELMTAISHGKSGRWDASQEALFAWPWAETNGTDGQYFPTKGAAIAHVQKL